MRVGQPAVCVASKSLLIPDATPAKLVFRAGGEATLIEGRTRIISAHLVAAGFSPHV